MTRAVFKLIGAAVLITSAVMWGIFKVRAERKTTDELEELCALVAFIGDNIAHLSRPLPEIFNEFRSNVLESCGFVDALRSGGMKAAVASLSCGESSEITREMSLFSEKLGMGYREEQTKLCNYTEGRLRTMLEERKKSLRDKEKLYRTIPVLLALSVILMFI